MDTCKNEISDYNYVTQLIAKCIAIDDKNEQNSKWKQIIEIISLPSVTELQLAADFSCQKNEAIVSLKNIFESEINLSKKAVFAGCIYWGLSVRGDKEYSAWEDKFNSLMEKTIEDAHRKDYDRELKQYIYEKKTNMYHYVNASIKNGSNLRNQLVFLKGWSSYTPLINSKGVRNGKFGGGFYFRYESVGFVVDPGCNFVENMHEYGIQISDIDCVIVTHSHVDHSADVNQLSTLNYEYNKIIASKDFEQFKNVSQHHITWIFDTTTYDEVMECKDKLCAEDEFYKFNLHRIKKNATIKNTESKKLDFDFAGLKVSFFYFPTCHNCLNSIGFKMILSKGSKEFTLGYSSDTGYFDSLKTKLSGCDILIANISELSSKDLDGEIEQNDKHLRLQGCVNLVNTRDRPKLYLISEFWGGKKDIRLYIIKLLLEKINNTVFDEAQRAKIPIIAGDVGLTISLDNLQIRCSLCGRYCNADELQTVRNDAYSRLNYVCGNCHIPALK